MICLSSTSGPNRSETPGKRQIAKQRWCDLEIGSAQKILRVAAFPIEEEISPGKFLPMAPSPCIAAASALFADASLSRNDGLVVALLISMVASVLICVAILRTVVRRELARRAASVRFPGCHAPATFFEAPGRWLAVRAANPRVVQEALGVQHARDCSWSDALGAPFEPRLFIAPPVNGWVLVMGCDLPDPADDVDECFKFLTGLSHKLGEVQFFSRNRAVAHHGWARLQEGRVVRAYAWAGETLWNQGEMTEAERYLKMRCLDYMQDVSALGLAGRELFALNTERVVRLAAAWSLDPTAVPGAVLEAKGIAGDLLHGRYH